MLLTSYPEGVVGPHAVAPCAKAGGIPVGATARGTNIAGLPLKPHLADGDVLLRGQCRMGLRPQGLECGSAPSSLMWHPLHQGGECLGCWL